VLLAAALLVCGCGDDYPHRRMRKDSPRAAQVAEMLRRLREGGPDGLEEAMRRDGAPDLEPARRTALRAALRQLVEAESAEIVRVDEFGENVYRATIELKTPAGPKTTAMLLVAPEGQGAPLRWAGAN
jgi:hypothetical protein